MTRCTVNHGFTLMEMLLVIAIIGILAAAIVPNLVGRDDQARVGVAKSELAALSTALDTYKLDNYVYPSTDQGLRALIEQPSGFPEAKNWKSGGYLTRKNLKDPWDNDYMYINTDDSYDLYTFGRDGQEGGEGYNEDIHHRDL